MSTATLTSSTSRPLRLNLRKDLDIRMQNYLGRQYWIVKDPVTLKYYRFEEEEYTLLDWLDGETSLEQLKRRFETQYAPQKISIGEMHQFFGQMFRSSLLVSDSWGQGHQLFERSVEQRRKAKRAMWSNFLAIRFRGIDPDRFLDRLNLVVGWMFSGPAALCGVLLMVSALLLLGIQFDVLQHRLPRFQQFFGPSNWFWLAIVLSVTKVLHEIGHGLACRRFGGRCHEAGVMLLLFMPCLYCNVTDSWMIPSKWKRAAIGAAGMYVELLLASVCTFLWWFSGPGLLNALCLNVMFVCSISTLLFNANPLMRYDGYYILSDLLEIPNLRQKASVIVQRWCLAHLLGIDQPPDPFLPHKRRGLFAAYALAALGYRWLIAFSIFWFLYHLLEPYGLKIVGQGLAVMGIYGLLLRPVVKFVQFLAAPGRMSQMSAWRTIVSTVSIVGTIVIVLAYPLPYYIPSPVMVQPRQAATVFVESAGQIVAAPVRPGEWVEKDTVLLELANPQLLQRVQEAYGQWTLAETRLSAARQEARFDEKAWDQVPPLVESVRIQRDHYESLTEEAKGLVIRAPRAGYVLAPRERFVGHPTGRQIELPTWQGSIFDPVNQGSLVPAATVVCQIGEPSRLEAVLAVAQEQMEFLRRNQSVDVLFPHVPEHRFSTHIDRIAPTKMESVPQSLDSRYGGSIVTEVSSQGQSVPQQSTYEIVCAIDDESGELAIGLTGQARIHAGRRSLGQRLLRYLSGTFSFRM